MTLETCKIRYDLAKKAGDQEKMDFWLERGRRKVKRHPDSYKGVDADEYFGLKKKNTTEEKNHGKKPER